MFAPPPDASPTRTGGPLSPGSCSRGMHNAPVPDRIQYLAGDMEVGFRSTAKQLADWELA